jgi:hypothetical protein
MRNQLTARTSSIPEVAYYAVGDLDGHTVDVHSRSSGSVVVGFGPCTLSLSRTAITELVDHLSNALEALDDHETVSAIQKHQRRAAQ